jgi:hypothetical protein
MIVQTPIGHIPSINYCGYLPKSPNIRQAIVGLKYASAINGAKTLEIIEPRLFGVLTHLCPAAHGEEFE